MNSAVRKAYEVMLLLRRSSAPLNLTEIARGIKIAPSTAHSILGELVEQGALLQDSTRRYHLGPAMFYLGASYHRNVPFYGRAWSSLVELADSTALTAVIAVIWADHHLILDVHKNAQPGLEVTFGGRVPLDAGAWGKAYFAWSEQSPTSLTPYTEKSIVDLPEYLAQVEQAREAGFAVDRDEFLVGAGAIASGVTSDNGLEGVIALVGALGQRSEADVIGVGQRLAVLASTISYSLGDERRVKVLGHF
jgi:DNA-binding IclR family transcriptional regulator